MRTNKFLAVTMEDYLNEQLKIKNNLNDNFWKWFSTSKLITDGNPNIYYHGTTKKITSFNKSFIKDGGFHGKGFYFYNNDIAGSYSEYVIKCYLKVEKPFDMYDMVELDEIKTILGDDIYNKNEETILDMIQYGVYKNEIYRFINNDRLQEIGYDGIIHDNVVVVFEPNQIKSINNDGSWNNNNDNIYS